MKAPNKMMIAVGALALTATTLLAGCGGSSTASTAASEPAAADAPVSLIEGLVKPTDVSDENWAATTEGFTSAEEALADLTPEELAAGCNKPTSQEDDAAQGEESAQLFGGGSVEEWMTVWAALDSNLKVILCSMAE